LAQKIGELLALSTQNVNSDSLGAVRVSYQEEKDKLEKKKGKEILNKVKTASSFMDSSKSEDDISEARDGSGVAGEPRTDTTEVVDSDDDTSNSSSDEDDRDQAFPPAKKSSDKPRTEKLLEKKEPEASGMIFKFEFFLIFLNFCSLVL